MLSGLYREIEALGGAPIMDDYDEGYTDGLDEALAILRKYGFGVDLAPAPPDNKQEAQCPNPS